MSNRLTDMTWKEFASRTADTVIVPVGSTEQHGPHLPLGTDALIAEHLALDIADRIHGIVAPTLTYGYKSKPLSGGGPLFPGTIDMNGATVVAITHDLLRELIDDGVRSILVLNSHFENEAFIVEAIDLVTRETEGRATIMETNWWDPLPTDVIEKVFPEGGFPGWALEHAAVTETSLMLHYEPGLVHLDRYRPEPDARPLAYARYPVRSSDVPAQGGLASPLGSSAQKGRLIARSCVDAVERYCSTEFQSKDT
ncbi:creatininase [uncultured Bifidobacterium sp.]|uniref:creatininase n=1 Tax=uncultured Bifidobacterium sp. TaxID=165187 RepID=UPI0028DCB84E|nr:creatininase [uncultured Bifidobacterium sp.]